MKRVIVISSIHRDTGRATAVQLLAILERVRPSVIFLELPAGDVDSYARVNLEAAAATQYQTTHPAELVPVDLSAAGPEFKQAIDYLFDRVEDGSAAYVRLRQLHHHNVTAHGFAYLNSAEARGHSTTIEQEMSRTVVELNDRAVSEIYASWIGAHERREAAMIANIRAHAQHASFRVSAFPVGLSHAESIVAKMQRDQPNGLEVVHAEIAQIP